MKIGDVVESSDGPASKQVNYFFPFIISCFNELMFRCCTEKNMIMCLILMWEMV